MEVGKKEKLGRRMFKSTAADGLEDQPSWKTIPAGEKRALGSEITSTLSSIVSKSSNFCDLAIAFEVPRMVDPDAMSATAVKSGLKAAVAALVTKALGSLVTNALGSFDTNALISLDLNALGSSSCELPFLFCKKDFSVISGESEPSVRTNLGFLG